MQAQLFNVQYVPTLIRFHCITIIITKIQIKKTKLKTDLLESFKNKKQFSTKIVLNIKK